ncbi:MAG: DinB family protein, partial [SAR202 cluster bacterium]|nr:DinB family protein [SAR202 cluster bacterium]
MTLNEFIEDAFNTEIEYLMDALGDITPEELMWRAGPEANPIGWILWHMTRVEDMW